MLRAGGCLVLCSRFFLLCGSVWTFLNVLGLCRPCFFLCAPTPPPAQRISMFFMLTLCMENAIGRICKFCTCTRPGVPEQVGIDRMAFTHHFMFLEVPLKRCVVQDVAASLKLKRPLARSTSFSCSRSHSAWHSWNGVAWWRGGMVAWWHGGVVVWYRVRWSGMVWRLMWWCGDEVVWRCGGGAVCGGGEWCGGMVMWWCGWIGGVVVWCCGGLVASWCRGVVAWWCAGVVAWWRGGVVAWWCSGVVAWWCGGVVVSWRGGVVAALRLKDAGLDQHRCQLLPSPAIHHCNQVLSEILPKTRCYFLVVTLVR